jgi:hypothetical protein
LFNSSWLNPRVLVRRSSKGSVWAVFFIHYTVLWFCIGFFIGATNPYYDLQEIIKILAFVCTGFAVAGLLAASYGYQEGASGPRRANPEPATYHTHHGPQGLLNHRTDHDPTTDHFNRSFLYDQQRYDL